MARRAQPDFITSQLGLFDGVRLWLNSELSKLDGQVQRQRRRYPHRLRMPKELVDRFFDLARRSRHHYQEYRRFCKRHGIEV
jgi:hypothetical protein